MPEKQESISKAHLAAGRAVDQLRRQLGILLHHGDGRLGACPIEGLTGELHCELRAEPLNRLHLLLTGARARSLGLQTEARTVRLHAQSLSLDTLFALADPLALPQTFPKLEALPVPPAQEMLLTLAKYASLLPALLTVEGPSSPAHWLEVSEEDVQAYWAEPPLDMLALAQARLPVEGAENARLLCFRQRFGTSTHLALIHGDIGGAEAPLARIHSSCVTGDILGSLRCDCGDQLKDALAQILSAQSGILLYLHQEGRGIGIANKLRAYQLQERGMDTFEANLMLGFDDDERDFSIAGAMLKKLGATRIRLLTNNPHKLAAIERTGIQVVERAPIIARSGKYNHAYLEAKSRKAGHLF